MIWTGVDIITLMRVTNYMENDLIVPFEMLFIIIY